MRNFFLIKHHPRGLTEVYQENSRQKRNLPDTRTIVQSLSNVQCRVVFWFFPLRRERSGSRTVLPRSRPLRTGQAPFDAPGSSLSSAPCGTRFRYGQSLTMDLTMAVRME